MSRPDFRDFRKSKIMHSAEGSSWKKHKYIKREDGIYYYPDSYEGGRHVSDSNGKKSETDDKDKLSSEEAAKLNRRVYEDLIAGRLYLDEDIKDFSNFKEMLAEFYGIDPSKYKDSDLKNIQKGLNNGVDPDTERPMKLTKNDIERFAQEVVRGNFGVGKQRKDLLGENYSEIQKRVNEMYSSPVKNKKVSEASSESIKKAEEAAKKISTILAAHRKKKK